jgi:hypothetical protein
MDRLTIIFKIFRLTWASFQGENARHGLRLARTRGQNYNEAFVRRHRGNYRGLLRPHLVPLRVASSVRDPSRVLKKAR